MNWCNDDPMTFSNIGERDVDFLLLEELRCSHSFRDWFLSDAIQVLSPTMTCPTSGAVFHSVHRTGESTGETDLLIVFKATTPLGSGDHAILIEDKIDAQFSDRTKCGSKQTERYLAEIKKNVGSGSWIAGVLLLVAPQGYLASADTSSFHACMASESIRDWFAKGATQTSGELAIRYEHKRQMVQAAISRWRRGWDRKADTKVSGIWNKYHSIAASEFPDVRMKYTGHEPSDSYTVSFSCLPRVEGLAKCRIDHVMERGTVDILVPGLAVQMPSLSAKLAPVLAPNAVLRQAGKSLGICIKVKPISRFSEGTDQSDTIRQALLTVRLLKQWFETNWKRLCV